jgi:hypothetical protein
MSLVLLPDKSIIDERGRVIFFSPERFRRDIVEGDCCFICGARPDPKAFNDEHVVPRWILKRFDLFDKAVVLPNGATMNYGSMTVPCCAECNSYLADAFEKPISQAFASGVNGVAGFLTKGKGNWLVFVWLCLLFFKFHYKDRLLREELDRRKPDGRSIAERRYEPHHLHHIHCVARSGYTVAICDAPVHGSLWALPAFRDDKSVEPFDYVDNYLSRSLMLRIGDCALVAILCDSCAVFSITQKTLLRKVKGPLSPLQLREFFAHASYIDLIIDDRPVFFSTLSSGTYRIGAEHADKVRLQEFVPEHYGRTLFSACKDLLASAPVSLQEHVKNGRYTFLQDENGNFNETQMRRKTANNAVEPTK